MNEPLKTRLGISVAIEEMAWSHASRMAPRIEAGKCCERVHPNGTWKSRYCRKPAVGTDPYGVTYCNGHLAEHLAIESSEN